MKVVISGTIGGRYIFPNELFKGHCYETWGNAWSLIEGIEVEYIPAVELIANPNLFQDVDFLIAELGQKELFQEAMRFWNVFKIATQSGAGFNFDLEIGGENKLFFKHIIDNVDLFLSTTYGGKDYFNLFTKTAILEIPLPIDLSVYHPIDIEKYNGFTICIGEIIDSCFDDRPLQIEATAIANSVGANVIASIPERIENLNEVQLKKLGLNFQIMPYETLEGLAHNYISKSHVTIMIGQRSTFGRFVNISWAMGVPCIATRYQCQKDFCPELTFSHDEIGKMRSALVNLRDDNKFYHQCRKQGLRQTQKMSLENTAIRIINEIIPLYHYKMNSDTDKWRWIERWY